MNESRSQSPRIPPQIPSQIPQTDEFNSNFLKTIEHFNNKTDELIKNQENLKNY